MLILALIGVLVGFHPVWRFGMPRSSETWSHLQNLERIPTAIDALRINKMLELFDYRQHYTKYPLFYFVAKLLGINSPQEAANYSAVVFTALPLLFFLLARSELDELEAFTAGLIVATTAAFAYTMNFFSGGEPLGVATMLLGLIVSSRTRPVAALPFYLMVVFLHPFTSIFLWLVMLVLNVFPGRDRGRDVESAIVTAVFSGCLLTWLLFQISLGLPLGSFITSTISMGLLAALITLGTGGSLGIMLLGDRLPAVSGAVSAAFEFLSQKIGLLLVILEATLLLVFFFGGVPGTEQGLKLGTILFYLPLLAAIPMIGLRPMKPGRLSIAFFASFITMVAAGLLVIPQGVPVYRLAPYGALALALLLGPVIMVAKARYALALILAGMTATSYPSAAHYFGFDEQYYPSESSALSILPNTTLSGRILTDVRMEDMARFHGFNSMLVPDERPANLSPRDAGLVTSHMRETGFYPPGSEWYREPFKLGLAELDAGGTRLYDSLRVQLYFATDALELRGVAD